MYIYMERVQADKLDDFETRIAFNGVETTSTINGDTKDINDPEKKEVPIIKVVNPEPIPVSIVSDVVNFNVYMYEGDTQTSKKIYFDYTVQNTANK